MYLGDNPDTLLSAILNVKFKICLENKWKKVTSERKHRKKINIVLYLSPKI